VIASVADAAERLAPLLGRDGWLEAALTRIEQDPLASRIPVSARVGLSRSARAAGEAMARDLRARERGSAEDALRTRGVMVHEDAGTARTGPFIHHALYEAPPPRVTLFTRSLSALQSLVEATTFSRPLGRVTVRELVLAHELCHHLVHVGGAPAAVCPRVDVLRVGPWRRRAVVRAAEEIAAGGFAAAWCGVPWAPDVLDRLTLLATMEALDG
jgi:hypothetical protein